MTELSSMQREIAELIIETVNLEDMEAADFDPQEALFGDGIGLDSIDALEIALAISQQYGVQMKSEDENVRNAFANLSTLCEFVEQHRSN